MHLNHIGLGPALTTSLYISVDARLRNASIRKRNKTKQLHKHSKKKKMIVKLTLNIFKKCSRLTTEKT